MCNRCPGTLVHCRVGQGLMSEIMYLVRLRREVEASYFDGSLRPGVPDVLLTVGHPLSGRWLIIVEAGGFSSSIIDTSDATFGRSVLKFTSWSQLSFRMPSGPSGVNEAVQPTSYCWVTY
jgi:hypothetical protein